jgi:broad specificity phosphatase PhoE
MRREPNLRKSEEVIQQRLQEIEQRIKQIESVRSRIKSETEQWQAVRETLDEVLATLGNHHTRYSTKLMEIELVRWQNKLRPLLTKLEALTYEQADARLKRLEGTIKDGEAMKATLKKQVGASDLTPEARAIAERVEETLASCQKIHEALVGHQAVLALKGVGTLPDTLSPTSLPTDELWKLEVFNIQVSITDFSSSFEELEAEYTRIQTEEQIRDIFEKTAGI